MFGLKHTHIHTEWTLGLRIEGLSVVWKHFPIVSEMITQKMTKKKEMFLYKLATIQHQLNAMKFRFCEMNILDKQLDNQMHTSNNGYKR